jgi:hypothetical protein
MIELILYIVGRKDDWEGARGDPVAFNADHGHVISIA